MPSYAREPIDRSDRHKSTMSSGECHGNVQRLVWSGKSACRAAGLLGEIYLEQDITTNARKYLEQSLDIARELRDRYQIARNQIHYGHCYVLDNDLDAAHASFTEAIDLFERLGMRRELAEACQALAGLDARETAPA